MVSTRLNSLIEVNQATLGISCTRTFGVSCLSFHNAIEWKFRTQHAEFRTLCWKFSTQVFTHVDFHMVVHTFQTEGKSEKYIN